MITVGFGGEIWFEAEASEELFKHQAFTNVTHTHRLRTLEAFIGGLKRTNQKRIR